MSMPSKEVQLVNASRMGDLKVVQQLLQEGAKVCYIDSNTYLSPLAAAIREKHDEIAEVLFPLDLDSTGVALSNAMQYNRPEWARRIIQRYKSLPDSKDAFLIALCFSKRYHDPSVVQALFENKNLHIPQKDLVHEFKKLSEEMNASLEKKALDARVEVIKLLSEQGAGNAGAILEKAKDRIAEHQPSVTPPNTTTPVSDEKNVEPVTWEMTKRFEELCRKKKYTEAKKLLNSHPGLKQKMGGALHDAIRGRHLETVMFLLAEGQNPSDVQYFQTPLQRACETGNHEIVAELLKAGVDVNATTGQRDPPIIVACLAQNIPLVKTLLAYNPTLPPKVFDIAFSKGGNPEMISLLLKRDSLTSDEKDDAIIEVCRQLVKRPNDMTVITQTVQMLLENGAKKSPKKLQAALEHAKDNDAITTLLQAHIVNEPEPVQAQTPVQYDQLRLAIHANRTNTEKLTRLFNEVVLPDAGLTSRHPDTPFYWAAAMGLIDEVERRLPPEHMKDRTAELRAAYDMACQFGRLDVLHYLTGQGVMPGQRSLAYASTAGHLPIVEFLLAKNSPTEAALYNASKWNRVEVVARLLTDKRINVNEVVNGKTALNIAREKMHGAVEAMLNAHRSVPLDVKRKEATVVKEPKTSTSSPCTDFSAGTEFLTEVAEYTKNRLKSKKFTRGKLKYQLAVFVLDKLSDTSGWKAEDYTKEKLLTHRIDISELKNSNLLTKKQKDILADKTHMSLDDVLNFQRYLIHGNTTRSYDYFHTQNPTRPNK